MTREYPLFVTYDASAFVREDGGTGKGIQLRNLLGPYLNEFTGLAPQTSVQPELPLVRGGTRRYLLWQQTFLARRLFALKPDVFLAPYNTAPLFVSGKTQTIVVVHDLILMARFPSASFRQAAINRYRAWLMRSSISRASLILTVSDYSRREILANFPETQVKVIPCTIGEEWFSSHGIAEPDGREAYVLLVTSTPPHKNGDRAIDAYAKYVGLAGRDSAAALRIVGLSSAAALYRQKIKDRGLEGKVFLEPFVSERDLMTLYRRAAAVLIPSLMEGFGIPVLEALATGTPAICSNATSLPEVADEAAVYFDPYDVDSMADALKRVLSDLDLRRSLSEKGLARAQVYHPAAVLKQVQTFWDELPEFLVPMGRNG